MISLRLNPYTDAEKKALDEIMQAAMNKFVGKYCSNYKCKDCPYRHVCYDLDRARLYINKIANGQGK